MSGDEILFVQASCRVTRVVGQFAATRGIRCTVGETGSPDFLAYPANYQVLECSHLGRHGLDQWVEVCSAEYADELPPLLRGAVVIGGAPGHLRAPGLRCQVLAPLLAKDGPRLERALMCMVDPERASAGNLSQK